MRKRPRISGTIIARILDIGASALNSDWLCRCRALKTYSDPASDAVDETGPAHPGPCCVSQSLVKHHYFRNEGVASSLKRAGLFGSPASFAAFKRAADTA
jgi:hypothetical protein